MLFSPKITLPDSISNILGVNRAKSKFANQAKYVIPENVEFDLAPEVTVNLESDEISANPVRNLFSFIISPSLNLCAGNGIGE